MYTNRETDKTPVNICIMNMKHQDTSIQLAIQCLFTVVYQQNEKIIKKPSTHNKNKNSQSYLSNQLIKIQLPVYKSALNFCMVSLA